MIPYIFNIKKFAVHDGDGIRTTVFFKGCSLRCRWCHNPESLSAQPQLAYYDHKCVRCGACVTACEAGVHHLNEDGHLLQRDRCITCGACVNVCHADALSIFGRQYTTQELLDILLEDKDFYETSGGGITLSGGECLLYPDFCKELLQKCKQAGLSCAIDTCGMVPRSAFDAVIPYTDVFLFDLKAVDEEVHRRCTGHSNRQILENLRYLNERGCAVEIRIPYVPSCNDGEIEKMQALVATLSCVRKVTVLGYHDFARSKYTAVGLSDTMPCVALPDAALIETVQKKFL